MRLTIVPRLVGCVAGLVAVAASTSGAGAGARSHAVTLNAAQAAAGPSAMPAVEAPVVVDRALRAKLDAIVAGAVGERAGAAEGVSIAIVEDGRLVYARGAGHADVASARMVTERTRFRVGSITKTITAVAVMQLVERGAMHLDDSLAAYLPDAPHAREVTLRQLLMHTSGIPNYLDDAFADGRVKRATTSARIAASMQNAALAFVPGTKYDYSNTGFLLLGLAVERVAKQSLAAYEREHIFGPAGMHDTGVMTASIDGGNSSAGSAGTATGYMDAHATPITPYDGSWLFADGDLVSTPSDIARFDISLMNGTLLSAGRFAEMRAASFATGEDGVRSGLGVTLFPLDELTFVGHHGGVPGFEADNEMLPDARFAVVVCGNAFDFSTASVNGPLLASFFPVTAARAVAQHAKAMLVASPGEDPSLTQRFRVFFLALQKGRVDRATVTAQMNAALGAEQLPEVAEKLAALGTLRTLIYHGSDAHPAGTAFHYTGVFDSQTTPLTFSLDASGKIAGVFLQ